MFAAAATPGHTEVQWEAVPGCPSEADVIRLIEERLGQALNAPRAQSIHLSAVVGKDAHGNYEVQLTTQGDSGYGQRRFSNASCTTLTEAVAFVMALSIDPELIATDPQRAPVSEPPRETEAPATPDKALVPEAATNAVTRRAPPQTEGALTLHGRVVIAARKDQKKTHQPWALAANAWVGVGLLPDINTGVLASAGFSPLRGLRLRVGAGHFFASDTRVLDTKGTISVSSNFVEPSLCALPTQGTWQTHACLGVDIGALRASGSHVADAHREQATYATALLEGGLGYRLASGIGVSGAVAAGWNPLRPRFGVHMDERSVQVFRPAPALFRLGFGLFWN